MRNQLDLVSQFVSDAGNIGRSVISKGWARPTSVEVRGENLVFDYREPIKYVRPAAGMMERFLRLEDAPDERIASYARRWGALTISPLDAESGALVRPPEEGSGYFDRLLHGHTESGQIESLKRWRAWVQKVRTLLSQAALLDKAIERPVGTIPPNQRGSRVVDLSREIQIWVNRYLWASMVRPHIEWNRDRWAIRMHFTNLLGAIVLQVVLMIAKKDGLAICSSCGNPFETDGKRKVYCEDCGLPAAQRAASKKHYYIKKDVRRRYELGESPEQIARATQVSISQTKRWIGVSSEREKE
jgi:hypothetical protein